MISISAPSRNIQAPISARSTGSNEPDDAGRDGDWLDRNAKGTIDWGQASLIATIPVTEHIKDELDPAGDSHLFEDSVDVVPDRMFLHLKPLSDFAVLQAVGDEADHIFFATRQ